MGSTEEQGGGFVIEWATGRRTPAESLAAARGRIRAARLLQPADVFPARILRVTGGEEQLVEEYGPR
jgi:hypothetical protein